VAPIARVVRGPPWKVECRMFQRPDQPERTATRAAVISLELLLAAAVLLAALAFLIRH